MAFHEERHEVELEDGRVLTIVLSGETPITPEARQEAAESLRTVLGWAAEGVDIESLVGPDE